MTIPFQKLVEISPPASEPVTLTEIKLHLRVSHSDDDSLINRLITTARMLCEAVTGLSLINRTYCLFLDEWPERSDIILPKSPIVSVTSIATRDESNVATTVPAADYYTDTSGIPGRIVLKNTASRPTPQKEMSGIEINYTAGYGADTVNVPAILRQGILQIAAHLYEHRGDSAETALIASGAGLLFQPFRQMGL